MEEHGTPLRSQFLRFELIGLILYDVARVEGRFPADRRPLVLPTCAYLNLKFALCVLRAGSLNLSTNTRQVFAHSFLSVFQT